VKVVILVEENAQSALAVMKWFVYLALHMIT